MTSHDMSHGVLPGKVLPAERQALPQGEKVQVQGALMTKHDIS